MRRSRSAGALLAAGGVVAGLAGATLAGGGDGAGAARAARGTAPEVPTATATARTRRLVDREDVDGRLGFDAARTLAAATAGTLTALRDEGSVVRRGGWLWAVDGRRTAFVMSGATPAWRELRLGVAAGPDVRQLERNLVALGHDPDAAIDVDETFDAATAAAVRRWQDERDVAQDGVVALGEVVFARGPVRVGAHRAALGDRVGAGRPVLDVSSTRRIVTAKLPAGRQALAERGDGVRVTLPDGTAVRGRVARVGRVARTSGEDDEATVDLEVTLRGRAARTVRLDGAPVTVSVAAAAPTTALAVPVQALVATGAGRYTVEVVEGGRRRVVPVTTGVFADGFVEVRGDGLRDGSTVVVPR